jgi:sulfur relay (sulfurtransferase) DsrF/TusC family protein
MNIRQLDIEQLSLPVVALDNQQMRELLRSADSVISL